MPLPLLLLCGLLSVHIAAATTTLSPTTLSPTIPVYIQTQEGQKEQEFGATKGALFSAASVKMQLKKEPALRGLVDRLVFCGPNGVPLSEWDTLPVRRSYTTLTDYVSSGARLVRLCGVDGGDQRTYVCANDTFATLLARHAIDTDKYSVDGVADLGQRIPTETSSIRLVPGHLLKFSIAPWKAHEPAIVGHVARTDSLQEKIVAMAKTTGQLRYFGRPEDIAVCNPLPARPSGMPFEVAARWVLVGDRNGFRYAGVCEGETFAELAGRLYPNRQQLLLHDHDTKTAAASLDQAIDASFVLQPMDNPMRAKPVLFYSEAGNSGDIVYRVEDVLGDRQFVGIAPLRVRSARGDVLDLTVRHLLRIMSTHYSFFGMGQQAAQVAVCDKHGLELPPSTPLKLYSKVESQAASLADVTADTAGVGQQQFQITLCQASSADHAARQIQKVVGQREIVFDTGTVWSNWVEPQATMPWTDLVHLARGILCRAGPVGALREDDEGELAAESPVPGVLVGPVDGKPSAAQPTMDATATKGVQGPTATKGVQETPPTQPPRQAPNSPQPPHQAPTTQQPPHHTPHEETDHPLVHQTHSARSKMPNNVIRYGAMAGGAVAAGVAAYAVYSAYHASARLENDLFES